MDYMSIYDNMSWWYNISIVDFLTSETLTHLKNEVSVI